MLRLTHHAVLALSLGLVVGCADDQPAAKPAPTKPDDLGVKPAAKPAARPASAPAAKPAAAPADPKAEAAALFKARCTVCHGENGKGDGPTAAAMNPRPRDYTDVEWQKKVSDEELAKAIVKGGPAVGKSPLMPANADLESKPEVVKELVAIIRGFGKKPE